MPWHLGILLFMISLPTVAQDFGAYPPRVHWQQINTPQLRVIFPEGTEFQAQRVVNTINFLEENRRETIGNRKMKLDLILNNFGVMSNGYVTLAPFRSEFFTTPFQNSSYLGSLDWIDLLSIHEYRHALQYMNMRKGWFGIANALFGNYTFGGLMNLLVPDWYFEGDAVATETLLTRQGRGRLPSFHKGLKAIALEDKRFSYEKARNGSFNDLIPDHYELGYLMTAYGRETYGNDLWMNVIHRTTLIKGIIYPFSQGLQLYVSKKSSGLFKETMEYSKEKWSAELEKTTLIETDQFSLPTREVTNYQYPKSLGNGSILVHKSSHVKTGGFYLIDPEGNEKFLIHNGISLDPWFSTDGKRIVWTTLSWHPRYSALNYYDLWIYDMELEKKRLLLSKTRYASPSISPDGTSIAVVETDPVANHRIVILNASTGEEIQRLPNKEAWLPTYPVWDPAGKHLYSSSRNREGEMAILRHEIATGKTDILLDFVNQVIGAVAPSENQILFGSSFSGIDNIYALKKGDKTIFQLSSVPYGAYEPTAETSTGTIIFSEFHRKGHRLSSLPLTSCAWEPVRARGLHEIPELNPGFLASEGGDILQIIPSETHQVKSYSKLAHLIRIHSWSLTPGFDATTLAVHSGDVMSQLNLQASASYYYNEQALGYGISAMYGGWYPIVGLSAGRQYRSTPVDATRSDRYLQDNINLSLNLPLNFTRGNMIRQISASANYSFANVSRLSPPVDGSGPSSYLMNSVGLDLTALARQPSAKKQLTTPFGMGINLSVNQSVGGIFASRVQGIYDLAIRGLFPTHNITMTAGYKFEYWFNDYRFMDLFVYPRGYSIPACHSMFTIQTGYHLPLLYPDFGIIGIVYFSRIRTTFFADLGVADVVNVEGSFPTNGIFASMGSELIFDTRWLNILPISMGVRTSLLLNQDQFRNPALPIRIEFVLPVFRL